MVFDKPFEAKMDLPKTVHSYNSVIICMCSVSQTPG